VSAPPAPASIVAYLRAYRKRLALQKTWIETELVRVSERIVEAVELRIDDDRTPPATRRELAVFEVALLGLSAKEIAGVVGISPRTVKMYLSRLYERLGVRDRASLQARFLRAS
jgi:DNA-binding NarL/FixJ family response regulator